MILVSFAFALMSWLSWRKWPDLLIDFGSQLYIPSKLAQGAVLYRDIAYLPGGPLSQYFNALLFAIFGSSLNVLLIANFLVAGLLVLLIYESFWKISDRLVATLVSLSVVTVFVFSQFLEVGNYNYICPYAHEALHGLLLGVVLVVGFVSFFQKGNFSSLALLGVCFGLIFLTKPEFFVAATAVLLAGFWLCKNVNCSLASPQFLLLGAASLAPLFFFFVLFSRTETFSASWRAVAGAWMPLLTSSVARNPFYQAGMGLDAPWRNIGLMALQFTTLAAFGSLAAWRFSAPAQSRIERILLLCGLGILSLYFPWLECGRVLPLLLLTALGFMWWAWRKGSTEKKCKLFLPILWLVFALFLQMKMGLHPRIYHYGVFLSMPAFVGSIWFLFWLIKQFIPMERASKALRASLSLFLLIGLAKLVVHSQLYFREKEFSITTSQAHFLTYNSMPERLGENVKRSLAWIEAHTQRTNTLAVLPEGAMLNYLSDRDNPTPYLVFMAEVSAFDEDKMFAAYQKTPPDYIVLAHRDSSEYGVRFFGQQKGYGREMMQWMEQNYESVFLAGQEPLAGNDFGVKILRRRDLPRETSLPH